MNFLYVGLGGFAGASLRYGVTVLAAALSWRGHWATLAVNVLGSLAIGFWLRILNLPPTPGGCF